MPAVPPPVFRKDTSVQFPELSGDYHRTPTLEEWKRQSSVALASRSDDPILTRIDEIIADYHAPGVDVYVKYQLKADLFFTLDYWLKTYTHGEGMKKGRQPAIQRLYRYAAHSLCDMFQCSVNLLPEYLERHFGRHLNWHGTQLDTRRKLATYLSRAQADKYRITFRDGKAWRFHWPGKGTELNGREVLRAKSMKLQAAQSRTAGNSNVFGLHPDKARYDDWAGFAMSLGRDLYMARHHCGEGAARDGQHGNFYHSSYLGGDPVLCAGTMVIRNGRILAVCNDSGHYRPTSDHFVGLLEALQMHGVNLAQLEVFEWAPPLGGGGRERYLPMRADAFLRARGNWAIALLQAAALGPRQTPVGAANLQALHRFVADQRQHDAPLAGLLQRLWLDAVAAGVVQNTDTGRAYFAGTLVPNYQNRNATNPFVVRGVKVDSTWILGTLERALGRPPPPPRDLPPGQLHGAIPPPPP